MIYERGRGSIYDLDANKDTTQETSVPDVMSSYFTRDPDPEPVRGGRGNIVEKPNERNDYLASIIANQTAETQRNDSNQFSHGLDPIPYNLGVPVQPQQTVVNPQTVDARNINPFVTSPYDTGQGAVTDDPYILGDGEDYMPSYARYQKPMGKGYTQIIGEGIGDFGQAVYADPVGVGKAIASGVYEGGKDLLTDPVGTVYGYGKGVYDSAINLGSSGEGGGLSYGLAGYLPEGVTVDNATPEQLTAAREAKLGDIFNVASLVPAVKGAQLAGQGAKSALDYGIGATKRLEFDPNTVGMNIGNVRLGPEPEFVTVYHATKGDAFDKYDPEKGYRGTVNKAAFGPGFYGSLKIDYPAQFVQGQGSLMSTKVDISKMLNAKDNKPLTQVQKTNLESTLKKLNDSEGNKLNVTEQDGVLSVTYVRNSYAGRESLEDRTVTKKIDTKSPEEVFSNLNIISENIKNKFLKDKDGYDREDQQQGDTQQLRKILEDAGFTGVVGVKNLGTGGSGDADNLVVFDTSLIGDMNKLIDNKGKSIIPPTDAESLQKQIDDFIKTGNLKSKSKAAGTLFMNMGDEGALMEFSDIGRAVNDYVDNINFNSISQALKSDNYPSYKSVLKQNLDEAFGDNKINVTRIEGYADPFSQKKKTNFQIDKDDVLFVGNPAEKELIIKTKDGKIQSVMLDEQPKVKSLQDEISDFLNKGNLSQYNFRKQEMIKSGISGAKLENNLTRLARELGIERPE